MIDTLAAPLSDRTGPRRCGAAPAWWLAAVLALSLPGPAGAARALPDDAPAATATLRARHAELRAQLDNNAFHRPIVIGSSDDGTRAEGFAYVRLDQPLATVAPALSTGARICEALFLHPNVRSCKAVPSGGDEKLALLVGPKQTGLLSMDYQMDYVLHIDVQGPQYLHATLSAASGPMGTSDYRVVIEATQLEGGRSFVHCRYTYTYTMMSRMAKQAYLATAGRSKVGFTVIGKAADGQPQFVGGERGSLERNAMRYYLAMVSTLAIPAPQQADQRLRHWFALTELYPVQLHELELDEYLGEKRRAP